MEKNKYKILVEKYTPKENRLYNGIVAFLIGGLVGAFGQLLVVIYSNLLNISDKEASLIMMITLIFIACLLTSLSIFDKMVNFARCGLLVPITGFAHSMMSAALEYRKEGLVTGIGSNMFKLAGTVIVFGVVSAYILGMVRLLIWGG